MIVPMKKVSLIIPAEKKTDALSELRKLGIVHIEITEGSGEKLAKLRENLSLLEGAMFGISNIKTKETKKLTENDALETSQKIVSLIEEKNRCISELTTLNAEVEISKKLGGFNPHDYEYLKSKGIDISIYEMPKAEYGKLDNSLKTLKLGTAKKSVIFLLFVPNDENCDLSALNSYKTDLPSMSEEEIEAKTQELKKRIESAESSLTAFASYKDSIKKAIESLLKEIEFEVYSTGMTSESLTDGKDDRISIAYFSGYIEVENLDMLKKTASDNSWALISDDPSEEDNVPTKLRNNRFVSLIYPLTDFLGTVPGYFEYDISGWFLSFILIFFGIIFGDGGYGLLISAVALVPIIKAIVSRKEIPPAFLLIGLFGLSTIVWGTLTCTWFGLSPEQLPTWLKSLSIPVFSNVYADKIWKPFWVTGSAGLTTAQNIQIFCFLLALIQLVVAHIKVASRNRKSLRFFGDIGSILQLIGMYYLVLSLVVNPEVFSFSLVIGGIPVGTVAIVLIAIGFVLGFVFANYEGSVVKSILSSLTNIVSVLLGVVNVFSDIVSYIRLWAVGLAGAAISATVNELAGPLLGNFLFMLIAIFILVFGHGLNMILNVLSVVVHGIRLNTLEFSTHLDMAWSGHKFKPFNETN